MHWALTLRFVWKSFASCPSSGEFKVLETQLGEIQEQKRILLLQPNSIDLKELARMDNKEREIRSEAKNLIKTAAPKIEVNDKDYVFISFILKYLPQGLIGLLLAVILSAAMSSTASELNALAATTVVDLYKRNEDVILVVDFNFWGSRFN